jgi:ribonuclease VapC
MILDTSAVVAIITAEPGWERLVDIVRRADELVIAAPTVVELGMVVEARLGAEGRVLMDRLLAATGAVVAPFDDRQASLALDAWRRYGKGRHEARLNFGDCCAYALAVERDEPLLFVGDAFTHTDVRRIGPDGDVAPRR